VPVYVSASSRLHALLTALMRLENSRPLRGGWSDVLGLPEPQVQFGHFGLPLVAKLVSAAGEEAMRAAEQVGLPLRKELVKEWSKPVYARGGNLDGPIQQQRVSPEALAYLDAVASVLRARESHEALPEGDQLDELLDQVSELAESVEASTDLPDDVRRALLRRIAQMRFAIENARVGGSEGVQEAVELLLGAAVARNKAVPKRTANKIFAVAAAAFAVFSAGPTVQGSLEAWPQVVETLAPGTAADEQQEQQESAPEER
jgi:hypothetical protein